ncbi:MAG: hypothetical protein ACOH2N_07020 [Devosia sp.]
MPTVKLKGSDYIYERISDDGRLTSYQVKIRRKNFPDHNCSFDDLDEARRFARTVLSDQDLGHRVDRLASHRTSVGEVIASITNGSTKSNHGGVYNTWGYSLFAGILCS